MKKPYGRFIIAAIFTGLTIGFGLQLGSGDLRSLRLLGAFFALLALIFFMSPPFILRKYGQVRDGETFLDTHVVVDVSLFSIVRHPQYLGYIFLILTFMLLTQHWLTTLFGLAALLFFYLHILQEEDYCLAHLGDDYQDYMQRVPRLNLIAGILRLIRKR